MQNQRDPYIPYYCPIFHIFPYSFLQMAVLLARCFPSTALCLSRKRQITQEILDLWLEVAPERTATPRRSCLVYTKLRSWIRNEFDRICIDYLFLTNKSGLKKYILGPKKSDSMSKTTYIYKF